MPSARADVAHLLRRAGFGGTAAEIDALTPLDWPAVVERVLDVSAAPPVVPPPRLHDRALEEWERHDAHVRWWLDRMRATPAPLAEKVALFWHGHFVSSSTSVDEPEQLWDQIQLFRTQGLGRLRPLAQAVAVQPAMLLFLNGASNRVGGVNENFARELLELFLLGVGAYSHADVVAAARAWTGHNYDWRTRRYAFFPERHDHGPKTFLGVTRGWDGPEIIDHVLTVEPHKARAARHVATKVWTWFAYPDPDPPVIDAVAAAYHASDLELRALLRAVFLHPEFRSPRARQGLVRTPVEFVVAAMRHTGSHDGEANPTWYLEEMGMLPLRPPNVSGWRPNAFWLGSTAAWSRADFARDLSWWAWKRGFLAGTAAFEAGRYVMSVPHAVQVALDALGIDAPSARTRQVLETWLQEQRRDAFAWRDWGSINLMTMAMLSPEFQLA